MPDTSEQVVLVTGAVGNLGLAVARAFAAAGARLVLSDRSQERVNEQFADLDGDHLLLGGVDVTDEASIADMTKRAMDHFGRIDTVVNTVGGFRAGTPVHETPMATWDLMQNLNARSVVLVSRSVVPQMVERGSGSVINIGAGIGLKGAAGMAAYSASKSAVIRITESMADELKSHGINVNCVLPGTLDTPQNREAMPKADTSRWVQPDSLAEVIVFLASPSARDIHGVALPVYGRD